MKNVREMDFINPIAEFWTKMALNSDDYPVGKVCEDGTRVVKAFLTDDKIVFIGEDGCLRAISWDK